MAKKNKKTFEIPQIDSNGKERDRFVSPFFGVKNKDEIVIPKNSLEGNINERFKDFRKEKDQKSKEELRKEFSILGSEEVRGMMNKKRPILNKDEKEVEEEIVLEKEPEIQTNPEPENKNENYITIEKEEPKPKKVEFQVPSFLQDETDDSPISEDELNEVIGDYTTVEETIIEEPETGKDSSKDLDDHAKEVLNLFDVLEEDQEEDIDVFEEVKPSEKSTFSLPSLALLNQVQDSQDEDEESINEQREIIDNTLAQFRVGGKVVNYTAGPTVTQFEVKLEEGVMINKLTNISNNIKMNLAAVDIRIEAPIPGKSTIGIEVPNKVRKLVNFGNLIDEKFVKNSKPLEVALGVNLSGNVVYGNIEKMPHGLIAGATGSGKSVCIDTILMSLLVKLPPKDLKLILIDPKRVGLAAYSKVPHLATPIIHDAKVASEALKWVVDEMERRYDLMFRIEARDIKSYNKKIKNRLDEGFEHVPNLVIVIEEMADLMAQAANEVELSISRTAAKARAAGIHLIVATQRPSVDVIKGSIKSNIPTRIALKVSSNTDSMTIIDYGGAESLLGNGDMLYSMSGEPLQRLQGAYVSDEEIDALTGYLSKFPKEYLFSTESLVTSVEKSAEMSSYDELFIEVAEYVIETDYASINNIQRNFNIGYNRASGLFNQLTEAGIVSSPESKTPRKVLMNIEQFSARFK